MKSAVVIIPTTGAPEVAKAIESCLAQDYPETHVLAVIDGPEFAESFAENTSDLSSSSYRKVILPLNVGASGFYGTDRP